MIGEQMLQHLKNTTKVILEITGHKELLQNNKVLRDSLKLRFSYVDILNLLQVKIFSYFWRENL